MSRIEDGGAVERLRERAISNGKYLGELLAVIHRDGGHYQAQHGDAKAVTDAIQAVFLLHTTGADAHDQLAASAAEITRLRAENAGMREALEPFAEEADLWNAFGETVVLVEPFSDLPGSSGLMVHHLRRARARAALSKASQAEGQTR